MKKIVSLLLLISTHLFAQETRRDITDFMLLAHMNKTRLVVTPGTTPEALKQTVIADLDLKLTVFSQNFDSNIQRVHLASAIEVGNEHFIYLNATYKSGDHKNFKCPVNTQMIQYQYPGETQVVMNPYYLNVDIDHIHASACSEIL